MKIKINSVFPFFLAILVGACNENSSRQDGHENGQGDETTSLVLKGKLLVASMGCNDCHSPKMMTPAGPVPDTSLLLSGHRADEALLPYDKETAKSYVLFNMNGTAAVGPWGASFAANLTSDETGIGNWKEEQFLKAMKEGKWKGLDGGRQLLPPMPWQSYSQLPDGDLKAIFAYLKTTRPVKNQVPAAIPPSGNTAKSIEH